MRASHDRSQNSVHRVGSRRAQLCDMNSLGLCTRGPTAARSGTPSSAATSCSTVPGPSSESGFKNSTYSPRASGSAWLFALGNPTFASLAISRTAGNRARTVSTVPSEEALSTRMISCGIDRALRSMDSRQETSSRRLLKLTMTMVTTSSPPPFDPLSLRERGNLARPSFPLLVLTPLIPSPFGRGETQSVHRSPSPRQWRGGQGVRTTRGGQGVRTTMGAPGRGVGGRTAPSLRRYYPPPIQGWRVVRLAQWARLLTPGRQGLRAGAWYSVVARTPKEVQLTVRGRTVTIARSLVELRDTPPSEWSVVHPANARESYMVCPGCRHRAQLPERRYETGRCPRCNVAFAIAWGETRAPSPAEGLKPDRRVNRRRKGGERSE